MGGLYLLVLVMRHLESQKNICKSFSSHTDHEKLTLNGETLGKTIGENIFRFVQKHNLSVNHVYCANSQRAITTARFIADRLSIDVLPFDALRSNKSGALHGKSEEEAEVINPLFVKQLKLFRVGLYSSYDFVKVYKRENKHDFEKRVIDCLSLITSDTNEDLKIVVLHHSSLTATMIHVARELYNYPSNFYGYVACELGNIYLWNSNSILLCNEPTNRLSSISL